MGYHDEPRREIEAARQPKGRPESLEYAVSLLSPYLRGEEKKVWGALVARPEDVLSAEILSGWFEDEIRSFNEDLYRYHRAPRLSHVMEQLNKLQELSWKLAKHISLLDRHTLQAIDACVYPYDLPKRLPAAALRDLCEKAEAQNIEDSFYAQMIRDGKPVLWIDRLDALSRVASIASLLAQERYGSGDRLRPDNGGRTNMYYAGQGHPLWHLIANAARLFQSARPGELSSSPSGPFSDMVHALFEYATGLSGEEETKGLAWRIKKVCRLVGRIESQNQRMRQIDEQRRALRAEANKGSLSERQRLRHESNALFREQWALLEQFETGRPPARNPT